MGALEHVAPREKDEQNENDCMYGVAIQQGNIFNLATFK